MKCIIMRSAAAAAAAAVTVVSTRRCATCSGTSGSGGKVGPKSWVMLGVDNALVDVYARRSKREILRAGLDIGDEVAGLPQAEKRAIYNKLVGNNGAGDLKMPGGSTLNTARIMSGRFGRLGLPTCFIGVAVDDDDGAFLVREANEAGVNWLLPLYPKQGGACTGRCLVVVDEESRDRTLVTIRGPSHVPSRASLDAPGVADAIRDSEVVVSQHVVRVGISNQPPKIHRTLTERLPTTTPLRHHSTPLPCPSQYAAAFVLSTPERAEAVDALAHAATEGQGLFALNLSSARLMRSSQEVVAEVGKLLPFTSLLFCNLNELEAFCAARHRLTGRRQREAATDIAGRLAPGGLLVVTAGSAATHVYSEAKNIELAVPVEPALAHEVVDTNGAGDSFVAGWLTCRHLMDLKPGEMGLRDVEACVQLGHEAASKTVRMKGCR